MQKFGKSGQFNEICNLWVRKQRKKERPTGLTKRTK